MKNKTGRLRCHFFDLTRWKHMIGKEICKTWVQFIVDSCPCSENFFSRSSGFPPSPKPSLQIPIQPGKMDRKSQLMEYSLLNHYLLLLFFCNYYYYYYYYYYYCYTSGSLWMIATMLSEMSCTVIVVSFFFLFVASGSKH